MSQRANPIAELEHAWNIDFADTFAAELRDIRRLVDDGLLEKVEDGYRVTPGGRMLLRNVAMCFDAYLPNHRTAQRFSRAI